MADDTRLAEPRPVLRGLRRGAGPAPPGPPADLALQSRDPFSGDCDTKSRRAAAGARTAILQSRDPFSGDCDGGPGRRTIPR